MRRASSIVVFWGAGIEFPMHQTLAVTVAACSETPDFSPASQRILLNNTVPERDVLIAEDRVIAFCTVSLVQFQRVLVSASGKQAGIIATLVLLEKPSCDGHCGDREDGHVTHLRPAQSDSAPVTDFMPCFTIQLMV